MYSYNILILQVIKMFSINQKYPCGISPENIFFFCVWLCRFWLVIWCFFHPRYNSQWLSTLKEFIPDFMYYFFVLPFFLRASISLLMLSVKPGNFWYHFYNAFWIEQALTGDLCTLPLGYGGGGKRIFDLE